MNGVLTGSPPLAKRKTDQGQHSSSRDRIDLRADPAWVARVQRQADRLGISLSDYIRQGTTLKLEQDEATDPEQTHGGK